MSNNIYMIAILMKNQTIVPLDKSTRRYGREAALMRAEQLQKECAAELKALDGERFIPYRVDTNK